MDGSAKSRKKSKKSLKVPKESLKSRKGSNSESQRRLRKSVTSRKRPEKTMQTMCTKILINDLKKFEMEAWHAKRRLVVQNVHPISTPRMHSNRHLPPPQLPPRSNENDVSLIKGLATSESLVRSMVRIFVSRPDLKRPGKISHDIFYFR